MENTLFGLRLMNLNVLEQLFFGTHVHGSLLLNVRVYIFLLLPIMSQECYNDRISYLYTYLYISIADLVTAFHVKH